MEFDEILTRKTPVYISVSVQLDGTIHTRIEELRKRFREEERLDRKENRPPVAPSFAREIEALLDKARETEVEFRFRSLGRAAWDFLVNQHRPTEEQKAEGLQWNVDTFVPALIAASCVEPKMTPEQAERLWTSEEWSGAELLRLFGAAMQANNEVADIPFDRIATELTRSTGLSSTTAESEEFRDLSS